MFNRKKIDGNNVIDVNASKPVGAKVAGKPATVVKELNPLELDAASGGWSKWDPGMPDTGSLSFSATLGFDGRGDTDTDSDH